MLINTIILNRSQILILYIYKSQILIRYLLSNKKYLLYVDFLDKYTFPKIIFNFLILIVVNNLMAAYKISRGACNIIKIKIAAASTVFAYILSQIKYQLFLFL
jgi:hypothetical protein